MTDLNRKISNEIEPKTCATCSRIYRNEIDFFKETSRWRICTSKHLWFNCKCGSTLMIKNGKYAWYSPGKTLSSDALSLFNKLGELKDLPKIATAIMEIQETLQSTEFEVPVLAKKIKQDPMLAARLLETASNIRSLRDPSTKKKFDNIEHAIMYIGKKALSELVMTISLQAFITNTKVFNADKFWKESFVTAELAELIATKLGPTVVKDEVYIAAALCNIGKIVGAIVAPNQIDHIDSMITNVKTLCTWPQAEAIAKTPNHLMFGEIGAAIWGLPPYVIDAIGLHHREANYSQASAIFVPLSLVDCVTLANQLTHWVLLKPNRINLNLLQKISKCRGIPMKDIEEFASKHSYLANRAA